MAKWGDIPQNDVCATGIWHNLQTGYRYLGRCCLLPHVSMNSTQQVGSRSHIPIWETSHARWTGHMLTRALSITILGPSFDYWWTIPCVMLRINVNRMFFRANTYWSSCLHLFLVGTKILQMLELKALSRTRQCATMCNYTTTRDGLCMCTLRYFSKRISSEYQFIHRVLTVLMRTIYGLFEYILKIFSGRYIFTPGTPRRVDDIFGPAYPSPSRKPSTEPFADTAVGEIVKDRQWELYMWINII
jgi:hypothetical protein